MLKLGLLGAGFMGGTHAAAFARIPDVQIFGISSRSAEKAEALAGKYGAKAFTDAMALATDPQVDIVSNTLPTHLHKDVTIAALQAGKHVLLEKPMALTVEDCDELVEAAKKADRVLMIGQVLRFWPEYVALVDYVKTGALGKPLAAHARRLASPPRWADFFLHPELLWRRSAGPAYSRPGRAQLAVRQAQLRLCTRPAQPRIGWLGPGHDAG